MNHPISQIATLLLGSVLAVSAWSESAPTAADDAAHFAAAESSILFWNSEQKIAGFRNIDALFPTRTITASEAPLSLPTSLQDLGGVEIEHGDVRMTVDEYFDQAKVAGLLVIKDGVIVYERYGLGNNAQSRWISFSVSKSVVSMLIGAAIEDGYIKNVDEMAVDYLPRLKDSSYAEVTIGNLLQMSSGVEWNEDYADPKSDIATVEWATLSLYEQLRHKPRKAAPGEIFNYNSAETNLAGTLLRSAIGNNLSTYLTEKIWQPFGMADDASWQLTEPGGGEFGGCCINATLQDYGRLGLFAMNNGVTPDGTRILPAGWMAQSTKPSKGADYYGYFWWLKPDGSYDASGIFGQGIHVNAAEKVVIALHSARDEADGGFELQDALYNALVEALSTR